MASRNAKAQGGGMYDTPEKLQSNTLKRHPKMDLSKTDLLRLLSYLEGELQARDVVIATLKAEKAKQLLYQAKYGRFGLGDPFMALQRDSDNMKDNSFDESAIKAMYDNQLAQLENLIATQRKAQLKMREQLAAAEKRYHKVCNELEDEKRKHAQDTAQGDDVTYMLEKERERLRQEIEYEKSQNKKMEKDLKKTLANLEEERANSIKHKQVAVMLIKEQKKLIEKLVKDRQKINKYEELLREEKDKTTNVVEGLVQESKKSLKMEAAMEKQMSDFEVEKEQLKGKLAKEEFINRDLACQIEALQHQVDLLQKQLIVEKTGTKDAFQSIEIKSSANPRGSGGSSMAIVSPTVGRSAPRYTKPTSTESSLRITDPPDRGRSTIDSNVQKTRMYGMQPVSQSPERQLVNDSPRVESPELRIAPIGAASIEKPEAYRVGTRVSASSPGGKILTVNVSHPNPAGTASNLSPRKIASSSPGGRGTPPPLPPNKPNISSPTPLQQSSKPALPAKIGVTVSKGVNLTGQESPKSSPRGIHIPISVVHSPGTVIPTTSHSSAGADKSASPLRKPAQLTEPVSAEVKINDFNTTHAETLDFLGPEMADLQNLLSSIMSDSDSSHNLDSSKSSSSSSSFPVSSLSSSLSSSDISSSPLHKLAAEGDLEALRKYVLEREADVNLPLKDGSTPLLFAAKYGHCECVKFLLDNGANPATCGDTRFSALHATAAEGHHACVKLLLDHGVNANTADHQNWTPLHMAATHGHLECCRLLLMYGAKLNVCSTTSWTPLHNAVHAGHDTCLDVMLDLYSKQPLTSPGHVTLQQLINIPDNDGWTLYHVAANKNHTKCLDVINKYSAIDVNIQDKWGRTVLDVANQACRQYLSHKVLHKQAQADIFLETRFRSFQGEDNSSKLTAKSYIIGSLQLGEDTKWSELEANLASIVTSYFCQLDTGLKTKRTSRLDPEITSDAIQYTLGLDVKSIHSYEIGTYTWRAGSQNTEKLPYDVMCNSNVQKIVIVLQDSIDTIACDVLFPVSVLHNYLRLLEHYKSVVFYGPEFTGKSYLAGHLANYLATKELSAGRLPSVHTVNLHTDFSHLDLVNTLLQTGCMMQNKTDTADARSPILILENMETINISQVFGKLLPAIEHQGQYHAFAIDENGTGYYFVDNFYIIATMNKSRSTGLELAVQQRFRWVHFRIDIEPIRNLLARHYQRKFIQAGRGSLPIPDSLTFRAVEWVVCVWQRLNDGVGKLGLHDVVFGPHPFLSCPLESNDPSAIHSWLTVVWNEMIAPSVREAVICGTGRETTSPEGQQKVANTALYVLMQKAVVPGCPLSGVEKEKFLCTFSGSNELELQMRMDKSRTPVNNGHASRRSTGSNVHRSTPHKHKHRSSMGSEEREAIPSSLTSKRRSLSETSLKNSIEYEEKKEDIEAINLSAKVRKLEIRPPAIFQFSSQARPSSPSVRNSLNNESSDMPLRTFSFSATSKSSSVSESGGDYSQTSSSRRSWSTENLSGAGKYGITGSEKSGSKTKSNSPFSFSLTTPTSSLSSFKYLETKSRSDTSQSKIPFRRSLNSIEDQSSKKDSHRSFVVSGLQTNIPRKTAVRNGRSQSYGNSSFTDSNANVKAEDIWIPQGNTMYFSDSETVGRNKSDSSFIRNSKLRKSIEKVSPENMFTDYEERRSFENGGSPFVRNASSRTSIEHVSHDSKFFPDQEITTSLNPDRKLSGYPSDLLSVGKGKTGIESEC